jgi:hypothetical protein
MKHLLILLSLLLSTTITACSGPSSSGLAGTVVTTGSLMNGSRLASQNSDGRSWVVEVAGGDLTLTVNGVSAVFRGAAINGQVNYQYDQATATWDFLVNGGVVHRRGEEVRVGDTTHDLSVPGEFVFTMEDWRASD